MSQMDNLLIANAPALGLSKVNLPPNRWYVWKCSGINSNNIALLTSRAQLVVVGSLEDLFKKLNHTIEEDQKRGESTSVSLATKYGPTVLTGKPINLGQIFWAVTDTCAYPLIEGYHFICPEPRYLQRTIAVRSQRYQDGTIIGIDN